VRYVQIEVPGGPLLTYETDLDLKVGDLVVLPALPWTDGPWRGRVTGLGRGGYRGPCKRVLRRLEPPEEGG